MRAPGQHVAGGAPSAAVGAPPAGESGHAIVTAVEGIPGGLVPAPRSSISSAPGRALSLCSPWPGAGGLAQAEVVHDRLADDSLLGLARADAELIRIGEQAAVHAVPRE